MNSSHSIEATTPVATAISEHASSQVLSQPASQPPSQASSQASSQILTLPQTDWQGDALSSAAIAALEAGKVLFFPHLTFALTADEQCLLTPSVRDPKARNVSLGSNGQYGHYGKLKGALGDAATLSALTAMVARFQKQAQTFIASALPHYVAALRAAPTSYRPMQVESRAQSWRADDRRLHVDAFVSRPNRGERILRVFTNVNPDGLPRVWRIGEPFETVASRFLPRAKPYSAWQAGALRALRITKTLRTEYDHLMLQLHDGMKSDMTYQEQAQQITMAFPPGSSWICFSDQASHAVMSGQYMLEQTLHLAPQAQYDPSASPLAILQRLTGRSLI